jgi:hypothetical protein
MSHTAPDRSRNDNFRRSRRLRESRVFVVVHASKRTPRRVPPKIVRARIADLP